MILSLHSPHAVSLAARIILNFNDKINLDSSTHWLCVLDAWEVSSILDFIVWVLTCKIGHKSQVAIFCCCTIKNVQWAADESRDTCNINAINEMVWFLTPKLKEHSMFWLFDINRAETTTRWVQNVDSDFHYRCRIFLITHFDCYSCCVWLLLLMSIFLVYWTTANDISWFWHFMLFSTTLTERSASLSYITFIFAALK